MESPLICLKAFLYKDNTLPIDQDTDGTEVISIIKKGPLLKKCLETAERDDFSKPECVCAVQLSFNCSVDVSCGLCISHPRPGFSFQNAYNLHLQANQSGTF